MRDDLINICIIHPNQQTTTHISHYLNNTSGYSCCKIFSSGEESLSQIPIIAPDVVLLDVHLPGITGIDCVMHLKQFCPTTQFMMYTSCTDEATVLSALKAGAVSYILNNCTLKELAGYIKELHHGGSPISSSIARKLIQRLQQPEVNNQQKYAITKREKEILQLLDTGCSYNAVAGTLFISSKTVRKHIYNIYEKLQVSNKIEAVNKFFGRK